jgi:hypothetical protein
MGFYRGPQIVKEGLVLYLDAANVKSYPGTGTTWKDLSGNGNNGTLINGPTFDSGNNGSIVFDGVNDYVNTTQIQFDRLNPFTLSAWVNTTNANNNQIINNENATYRGYQFAISSGGNVGRFYLLLRNTTNTNFMGAFSTNHVPINTWVYLVATYNGSSLSSGINLYFNGVQEIISNTVGNNLTSTIISNETTWIGQRRPSTQGPFSGKIPQCQIYNRALTAQEILQNYNATKTRFGL